MSAGRASDDPRDVPAGGDARSRAERAILLTLMSLRGVHLAQGALCTATAWRSYRRPRLVAAMLAVSAAESVWLARRGWDRGAIDEPTAWIDSAVGIGGLVALGAGTTDTDRTTWMNWMCPVSVGSATVATTGLSSQDAAATVTALAGTYLLSVKNSLSADASALATVVVSALSYFGFFVAADRFAGHLRGSAVAIEQARCDAVEQGERAAIEQARNRQHRVLNQSVLETLDIVARGWDEDRDREVRARVRREAARLRSVLRGDPDDAPERLAGGLRELAEDFAAEGLHVELLLAELDIEPPADAADALCDATSEALRNVVRHAGVSSTVVRACSTVDHVELTVRDHGAGWDTDELTAGGGISTRILAPLRRVGGLAEVQSSPGRGTLVVLRVPR